MKIEYLSESMVGRIIRALNRTWDAVAMDSFVDDMGNEDHNITYSREEVFQISADASFDVYHGDKEAYETFRKLTNTYDEIETFFAKKAFPFHTYGY